MPEIFTTSGRYEETWLRMNEDGTLTFERENNGHAVRAAGLQAREEIMSSDEAKRRWPEYANKIDEALRDIKA